MILSIRTAGMQDGKQAAGFAWAIKVAAHVNASVPGIHLRVTRSIGGPVSTVHWIAEYASLADFETKWAAIEGNAGYQALLKEARDQMLFESRTLRDDLHQTIG